MRIIRLKPALKVEIKVMNEFETTLSFIIVVSLMVASVDYKLCKKYNEYTSLYLIIIIIAIFIFELVYSLYH